MLKYIVGDVTKPVKTTKGSHVIVHIVSDRWVMGAGVALTIKKKWPIVFERYLKASNHLKLGDIQVIPVTKVTEENHLYVCNLMGQKGLTSDSFEDRPPIRYDAIYEGLTELANKIRDKKDKIDVHMPKIGTGLAKGSWIIIEELIKITLISKGIDVYIYELK